MKGLLICNPILIQLCIYILLNVSVALIRFITILRSWMTLKSPLWRMSTIHLTGLITPTFSDCIIGSSDSI